MPFRILSAETNEPVTGIRGFPVEFENPQEAKSFAKRLTDNDHKYRIKKVHNTEWVAREQKKFADGTHTAVPWADQFWWETPEFKAINALHFPHPSKKEPGMLAYIETPEKGAEGIYTRVKPGRYLEKHFAGVACIYAVDTQYWARYFSDMYEPKKLFIATSEDDIQWVYENGPGSCMSDPKYRIKHGWGWPEPGKWPDNWHACRAYAAGDLQVAYLVEDDEKPTAKKKVIARSVIWPEKKTFSRCYGSEEKLKLVLKQLGYHWAPPIGAKIQRKPFDRRFIVPYIDAGQRAGQGSLNVLDKETHMEICPKDTPFSWNSGSVSGLCGTQHNSLGMPPDNRVCYICGRDVATIPNSIRTESVTGLDGHHYVCGDHRAENTFCCGYDGNNWLISDMPQVCMFDNTIWSQRAFNAAGFICQATGNNYPRRLSIKVGKKLWNRDYAYSHAFNCEVTGIWYENSQKIKMYPFSGSVGPDALTTYGFVCEECSKPTHISYRQEGNICRNCFMSRNPGLPLTTEPKIETRKEFVKRALDHLINSGHNLFAFNPLGRYLFEAQSIQISELTLMYREIQGSGSVPQQDIHAQFYAQPPSSYAYTTGRLVDASPGQVMPSQRIGPNSVIPQQALQAPVSVVATRQEQAIQGFINNELQRLAGLPEEHE